MHLRYRDNLQLDSYNSGQHPGNDADTVQTIKMVTEQNDRLSKMVKTLLDMSELQTVGRDETIMVDALVDEVLADLEPLAREKDVELNGNCEAITIVGSDILSSTGWYIILLRMQSNIIIRADRSQ